MAELNSLEELGTADGQLARTLASDGPRAALEGLTLGRVDADEVLHACLSSDRPEAAWARDLASRYPGDASVATTLLLNHVVLAPGQALRLDAGMVHAYLRGAGIELMRASDNVVRAGLTVKPVDVDELLRILDPTPLADPVLPDGDRFELPAADVALVRLAAGAEHRATIHEIAIEMSGVASYLAPGDRFVPSDVAYVVTSL